MSTLTKLFALLVSVLSIFLCGVIVVFAANTANYRTAYMQQKTLAEAAKNDAYNAQQSLVDGLARRNAAYEIQNNNLRALEMQYDELMRKYAQEAQISQQSRSEATVAVNTMKALRDTIQDMYTTQNQIQTALSEAHQQMVGAQTKVVELRRELEGQRNRADQLQTVSRQYEEKVYEMEDTIEQLRSRLQQVALASRNMTYQADKVSKIPEAPAGVPIRGQITEIREDLASISIGSASGVQEDMTFKIFRDDQYLGDLKIIYVEPGESAGRLVLRQGDIVRGDNVTTGFN